MDIRNARFHAFNWLVRWADRQTTRMAKERAPDAVFRRAVRLEFRLVRLRGRYYGSGVDWLKFTQQKH